jgi:formylglycine-generating enzyme required for sulfatase activity/cyclophilin family peptidyl-prolyl cis-trans isomerase
MLRWEDRSSDEDIFLIEYSVNGAVQTALTQRVLSNVTEKRITISDNITNNSNLIARVYACKANISYRRVQGVDTLFADITERSAPVSSNQITISTTNSENTMTAAEGFEVVTREAGGDNLAERAALSDGELTFKWQDQSRIEENYWVRIIRNEPDQPPPVPPAADTRFDGNNVIRFVEPFGNGSMEITESYGNLLLAGANNQITDLRLEPGRAYRAQLRPYKVPNPPTTPPTLNLGPASTELVFTAPALLQPAAVYNGRSCLATPVGEASVRLDWTDSSENEGRYLIYANVAPSTSYNLVSVAPRNERTITLSPAFAGQSVVFRVVADFALSGSAPDSPAAGSVSTDSESVTVAGLTAPTRLYRQVNDSVAASNTIVDLFWFDNSSVEQGYEIWASTDGGVNFGNSPVTTVGANVTRVRLNNELQQGRNYTFRVSAFAAGTRSGFSNTVSAETRPGITSSAVIDITKGQPLNYQLTTSTSATSFNITNLPAGLNFSTAGVLSISDQNAVLPGVYEVTFEATFLDGWVDRMPTTLRIKEELAAPVAGGTTAITVAPNTAANSSPEITLPISAFFSDADTKSAVRVQTNIPVNPASATPTRFFDIILYPDLTPQSVDNMIARLTDYTNTVVHRAPLRNIDADPDLEGFVVQAGFFRPSTTGSIYDILPAGTSPQNEPGISNLRGTVAWAKRDGDPNSATHDFFVNTENNVDLDLQNGGFTVFGRVPTTGMEVVDQIQTITTRGTFNVQLRSPETGQVSSISLEDWPLNNNPASGSLPAAADLIQYTNVRLLSSQERLNLIGSSSNISIASVVVEDEQININAVGDGTATITLTATDLDGNVASHNITVTVDSAFRPASISSHPSDVNITTGGTANFNVSINNDATGPVTYQWQKNDVDLPDGSGVSGATTANLEITDVQLDDLGSYRVIITDPTGSLTSNPATLSIATAPVILTQPDVAITANYASNVSISVEAVGPGLQYQWYRDTEKLLNGGNITGATAAELNLSPVGGNDAATYKVRITNALGSVESEDCELIVNDIDTDGDGLTDSYEVENSLNRNALDSDGDGYNDGIEEEVARGSARTASRRPSTSHFIASEEMTDTLNSIEFQPITKNSTETRWLSEKEITQAEFAAVLQWAMTVMNVTEFREVGGRTAVVYPRGTDNVVCYPVQSTNDNTAPNSDIQSSDAGRTFFLPKSRAQLPMNRVSYYGALLAAEVLNDFHFDTDFTILSETDWQLAARGGTSSGSLFPTGADVTRSLANFNNPRGAPRNVGSFRANPLGIHDLAGNVAEWTSSLQLTDQVVRGGSYASAKELLQNDMNQAKPKSTISTEIGIRLGIDNAAATLPLVVPPTAQSTYMLNTTNTALALNVVATGAPQLTYQWYKDNVLLRDQTAASLFIARPRLSDAGRYHVTVSSRGGPVVRSGSFYVGLLEQRNPVQTTIVANRQRASFTANAAAPAGLRLRYRWQSTANSFGDSEDTWFRKGRDTRTITIFPSYNGNPETSGVRGPINNVNDPSQLDDTGIYACFVEMLDTNNVPVAATTSSNFQLIVPQLPEIPNNYADLDTAVGVNNVLQLTSSNNTLVTRWLLTGLPPGLTYNPATGSVSGRPTRAGEYTVVVRGFNAQGGSSESSIEITVDELAERTTGEFVALLNRSVRPGLGGSLGGRVELNVSASSAFTGKITFGATAYNFRGALDQTIGTSGLENPTGYVEIPRRGSTTLRFGFSIDRTTGALEGVTDEVYPSGGVALGYSSVNGWRNDFNGVDLSALNRAGIHGFSMDAVDSSALPSAIAGHSYGRAIVPSRSSRHRVNVSGRMADGAAFTCSHPMSADGNILLYTALYRNQGSVHGLLQQISGGAHVINADGPVTWLKKSAVSFGGVSGVEMTVNGALYQERAVGAIPLGYAATESNGRLIFDDGPLGSPITQIFTVSNAAKNFLSVAPTLSDAQIGTVRLRLDLRNGTFSGSFKFQPVPLGSVFNVNYAGVLLRNSLSGSGTDHVGVGSFSYINSNGTQQTGAVNIARNN